MASSPDGRAEPSAARSAVFLLIVLGLAAAGQSLYQHREVLARRHEVRALETAREMLERGDWIVPHYEGGHRFEKPPLPYWLAAGAMALTGARDPGVARLTLLLPALAMIAATAAIGSAVASRRTGLYAAAIVASAHLFLREFRKVTADPFLAAGVTVAVACWAWALRTRGRRSAALYAGAYVALAFAVLAKGPIALVFTALGAACTRPARPAAPLRWRRHALGTVLAILPALAWAAAAAQREPEGLRVWFHEVFSRLGGEDPGDRDERSRLDYVPEMLLMLAPWTLVLLAGLRAPKAAGAEGAAPPDAGVRPPGARAALGAAVRRIATWCRADRGGARAWLAGGILFLLLLSSRKAAYLLPLLPAAALVASAVLAASPSFLARWQRIAVIVSEVAIVAAAGGLIGLSCARMRDHSWPTFFAACLLGLAGLATAAAFARRRAAALPALLAAVAGMALWAGALVPLQPERLDRYNLGILLGTLLEDGGDVVGFQVSDPVVSFYADRTIRPLETAAEVAAIPARPLFVYTTADREAVLSGATRVAALPARSGQEQTVVLRIDGHGGR